MSTKRFTDLDPVVLHRQDLLDLEQLLHNEVICQECDYFIHAKVAGHELSAKPFHGCSELLQAGFPRRIDQLDVNVRRVDSDKTVAKSVRLLLDRSRGDVSVYSDTSQEWVMNTSKALTGFFQKYRPWYAWFAKALGPMFNISMVISLLLTVPAFMSGKLWLLVFPFILLSYSVTMLVLGQKQLLFPYTRIALYPDSEDTRPNYESWALLAWLVIVIASVSITLLLI